MEVENPNLREWAERISQAEMAEDQTAEQMLGAIERTCRTLLPKFADLLGERGYRLILSRSLVLAGRQISWLNNVSVGNKGEGCLIGLEKSGSSYSSAEVRHAFVEILTSLFVVLGSFVGEQLVLYELKQAYPEIFAKEDSDQGRRT
jgi:hypothetical protein